MTDLFGDGPPAGSLQYARTQAGFDVNPKAPAGYVHERDHKRLTGQLGRVYDVVKDGQWHTITEIQAATFRNSEGIYDSITGISARLRDLRKPKFGGHEVERQHVGDGLYRYRFIPR